MTANLNLDRYFSGEDLYGDNFNEAQIRAWFEDEKLGFYNLIKNVYFSARDDYLYEYHALNHFHAYRHIRSRSFRHCLAIGCARGDDIAPLADHVEKFTCIEPAQNWWSDQIKGKPATFMMPELNGSIPCDDSSFDLVVALSVLHHIANVSSVLKNISRVLCRDGIFILHEPVISMGDWTKPRYGLTKNERGLPLGWLKRKIHENGMVIEHMNLCQMPTTSRLGKLFGTVTYNSKLLVWQDYWLSRLMSWNLTYHRKSIFAKFCPTSSFMIIRKL